MSKFTPNYQKVYGKWSLIIFDIENNLLKYCTLNMRLLFGVLINAVLNTC